MVSDAWNEKLSMFTIVISGYNLLYIDIIFGYIEQTHIAYESGFVFVLRPTTAFVDTLLRLIGEHVPYFSFPVRIFQCMRKFNPNRRHHSARNLSSSVPFPNNYNYL